MHACTQRLHVKCVGMRTHQFLPQEGKVYENALLIWDRHSYICEYGGDSIIKQQQNNNSNKMRCSVGINWNSNRTHHSQLSTETVDPIYTSVVCTTLLGCILPCFNMSFYIACIYVACSYPDKLAVYSSTSRDSFSCPEIHEYINR